MDVLYQAIKDSHITTMNSNEVPLIDYGIPAPDRRPITIRATRPMLLRRIDAEDLAHIEAGSTITITRHDLGCLGPGDWRPVE